jgi:AhpD family alkylhydroperoxidase
MVMTALSKNGFPMHPTAPAGLDDEYAFFAGNFGFAPHLAQIMAGSPGLLKGYVATQKGLLQAGNLTPAEVNVVQLAIAVENECSYCTAGHTAAGKLVFGSADADMAAIRACQPLADPKLAALQRFAARLYGSRGRPDEAELQGFLDAGFSRAHALDVVACIAAKVMSNYTNALAGTAIDPQFQAHA